MEFLLLFILNIFTGTLIYLILSLKMERTSSTYQEQKLKKEMGEIITEFNATAERNITLLENKIALPRRLMGETGAIRSLDVLLEHKPENEQIPHERDPHNSKEKPGKNLLNTSDPGIITKKASASGETGFLGGIIDKMQSLGKSQDLKREASGERTGAGRGTMDNEKAGADFKEHSAPLKNTGSRIDFRSDDEIVFVPDNSILPDEPEEDIAGLFMKSNDKYALIVELSSKGYSIEELAGYSGLPSGEVKLVISLNN